MCPFRPRFKPCVQVRGCSRKLGHALAEVAGVWVNISAFAGTSSAIVGKILAGGSSLRILDMAITTNIAQSFFRVLN